jgi:hypothetical protein
MTAADSRVRPRPPRAAHFSPAAGRLLRVELRRNPMPWMVPLLAALFLFDPYRTAMGYPPIWDLRASVVVNKLLPDFVAFAGGVSAWLGSREGRRRTADLIRATPRPGWARHATALAATFCWMLAAFLVFVGVLYAVFAHQATGGSLPWWPVAVGAAALAALCATGFAAGVFFPGRFTAPLAAFGAFLISVEAFHSAVGAASGYALLSPSASVPNIDVGIFYPYPPDLPIAQAMFLTGIAVAAVGVLGLSRSADDGRRLRRAAAITTVAGVVAAGTAIGLTGTARLEAYGVVIPALHDAASDRPIPYSPVCSGPVCVHPAFQADLHDVTIAAGPVLSELAGLPGAPVRVDQMASDGVIGTSGAVISGTPPVFYLPFPPTPGSFGQTTGSFIDNVRNMFVTTFISRSAGTYVGTSGNPAQQAVETALLTAAGTQETPGDHGGPAPDPQITAAAKRFAAQPAAVRHAWLAANLPALWGGHITLAQLP